jgi:bifunctional DNase/RNase
MPLRVERFDEEKRILALKDADGDRYLFIGFGEKEAAEIGRALRLEAPSPDAHRETWMDMIEHRGATLDAVVITDLVDGVFKANVVLTQDVRTFDVPARPADAIAWAMRAVVSTSATDELMHIATVRMTLPVVDLTLAGFGPNPLRDDFGTPVATFIDPFSARRMRLERKFIRFTNWFFILFGLLVVGSTSPYLIDHVLASNFDSVVRDLKWFLPMYGAMALGLYFVHLLNHANKHGRAELEIYPFGVRVWMGKIKGAILWSALEKPGVTAWFVPKIDGLKSKNRRLGVGGLGLSPYEKDWRDGEIGGYVRRYAPRLLGIEPIDPEGGSPVFQ